MELFLLLFSIAFLVIIVSTLIYEYKSKKKYVYIKKRLLMVNDGDDPCHKDHSFKVTTHYSKNWIQEDQ